MNNKTPKDRLKPITLHGIKPEEALEAFMQVKPEDKKSCDKEDIKRHNKK